MRAAALAAFVAGTLRVPSQILSPLLLAHLGQGLVNPALFEDDHAVVEVDGVDLRGGEILSK
jgi:hypothetical protein